MLGRLARVVVRHHWLVVGVWAVLTLAGVVTAPLAVNRMLTTFSIPGSKTYQANQQIVRTFHNGDQPPLVIVLQSPAGDITHVAGVQRTLAAAMRVNPGARLSSFFSTHSAAYVSRDHHTTFAELYPPGANGFGSGGTVAATQRVVASTAPNGVHAYVTGNAPLQLAAGSGGGGGPSILVETAVGGLGALVILLFVFGTLPAIAMPLLVAAASILNTFTVIWLLTYLTGVSVIVEFLVGLVGLGVAIDYSLLYIFRFREELAKNRGVEEATVQSMEHAGRSIIVSGSTVGIGLVSMIILPIPFIRSIGIGGLLIPTVSVIAALTLLPAICRSSAPHEPCACSRLAGSAKITRAGPVGAAGLPVPPRRNGRRSRQAIVALLWSPPETTPATRWPGSWRCRSGTALTRAGVYPRVDRPRSSCSTQRQILRAWLPPPRRSGTPRASAAQRLRPVGAATACRYVEGVPCECGSPASVVGPRKPRLRNQVTAASAWQLGKRASSSSRQGDRPTEPRQRAHPSLQQATTSCCFVVTHLHRSWPGVRSGPAAEGVPINHQVSLGAAYGIIVFIFQQGHGSQSRSGTSHTTGVIILKVDPLHDRRLPPTGSRWTEVFMLTRMREICEL